MIVELALLAWAAFTVVKLAREAHAFAFWLVHKRGCPRCQRQYQTWAESPAFV